MRWIGFVFLLIALPACSSGPPPVKVSGKVVYNGQPLKNTQGIGIVFHPVVEAGKKTDTYNVQQPIGEDGSFTVPGGIPPGKYKIEVRQMIMPDKPGFAESQKISEMFAKDKTQMIWDITADSTLTFDLAKPAGK